MTTDSNGGTPRCPVAGGRAATAADLERYNPLEIDQATDPEPWMSCARDEKPVFMLEELGRWCVTREAEVSEIRATGLCRK